MASKTTKKQQQHAGMLIRFAAQIIDGVVVATLSLGLIATVYLLAFGTMDELKAYIVGDANGHGSIVLTVGFVVYFLYYILLTGSDLQATIGKRLVGIYVGDSQGKKISYLVAIKRYVTYFLSTLLFCIGHLFIGWTDKKTALHDILVGTYVLYGRPDKKK